MVRRMLHSVSGFIAESEAKGEGTSSQQEDNDGTARHLGGECQSNRLKHDILCHKFKICFNPNP